MGGRLTFEELALSKVSALDDPHMHFTHSLYTSNKDVIRPGKWNGIEQ